MHHTLCLPGWHATMALASAWGHDDDDGDNMMILASSQVASSHRPPLTPSLPMPPPSPPLPLRCMYLPWTTPKATQDHTRTHCPHSPRCTSPDLTPYKAWDHLPCTISSMDHTYTGTTHITHRTTCYTMPAELHTSALLLHVILGVLPVHHGAARVLPAQEAAAHRGRLGLACGGAGRQAGRVSITPA